MHANRRAVRNRLAILIHAACILVLGRIDGEAQQDPPTTGTAPAKAAEAPAAATSAAARLLATEVLTGRSPGAALLVLRGGRTVEETYLGRFHAGLPLPLDSASAWLSAATVLAVVDAGLANLDDPLSKFFPGAPADKAGITLRQLLAHTSGLPSQHPCLAERASTLEACARELLEVPLRSAPGKEFHFGGCGLQLAGRIVEIAAGRSWEEVFQQRLGRPLGLEKTTYGSSGNPHLAAGARGTIGDYGRFLAALLPPRAGSRPLLSPVMAVEMFTDHSAGATRSWAPFAADVGYGLGVRLETAGRAEGPLASCPGQLGFTPWLSRARDLAAIAVFLALPPEAESLRRRLEQLLFPPPPPAPPD